MNVIKEFTQEIRIAFPEVDVNIDPPFNETGVWYIDIRYQSKFFVVEFRLNNHWAFTKFLENEEYFSVSFANKHDVFNYLKSCLEAT